MIIFEKNLRITIVLIDDFYLSIKLYLKVDYNLFNIKFYWEGIIKFVIFLVNFDWLIFYKEGRLGVVI